MLELQLEGLESTRVGSESGLELDSELRAWEPSLRAHHQALLERAKDPAAMLGWIGVPEDTEALRAVRRYAEGAAWARDVVVLGIGGSALPARGLYEALAPTAKTLHFLDHTDPLPVRRLLGQLAPETTLVVAVSKSGSTAETAALLLVFRRWLEDALGEDWRRHLAAVTDPEKGPLRAYAGTEGLAAFAIPPDVGGRFSALTPVGTLPLALAGADVEKLLMGARRANRRALETAAKSALVLYLLDRYRKKPVHVFMPYGRRLFGVAQWFAQLHAESLGKARNLEGSRVHAGPTPLAALGPTDQHSLLQLLREGPFDKAVVFLRMREPGEDLTLPAITGLEAFEYLFGKTLFTLQEAEAEGTRRALLEAGRPSLTLWIDRADAESLGELYQFLMWQTAFLGALYGVNAFDQPGVELAKVYAYALLGRKGYEEMGKRLKEEA